MVDGSYVNQNGNGYYNQDQYDDDNSYGYYNQDQYGGYQNQNYQSSMQIPVQQSSASNFQASSQSSGGRLLRKGIISLNAKNSTPQPQQTSQINENSTLSNQPVITKPKINGPTQIPSQISESQVPNIKATASNSSYNDQIYYNDYQQQQEQQYYEEENNENYDNQIQQQQPQQQQQFKIPVKIRIPQKTQKAQKTSQQQQQQQQLPKPAKQTSINYSYENEDQNDTIASYSNTDLFQQRQPMIESNFSNTLDRSINNFKRIFSNEFQSILRQVKSQGPLSQRTLFDVDEYCESLKSDISTIILTSPENASLSVSSNGANQSNSLKSLNDFDSKSSTLSRKVAATIDEYTKPFSASLAEAASRNAIQSDHHISELRQLQEELESLTSIFKSTSDSIVKELQRESQNAASLRDKAQQRHSDLSRKLKTMKMKTAELESRTSKLSADRQTVESDIKMLAQKRSKWEQDTLPLIYDEAGALRQRIIDKLSEIKKAVENEASLVDVIDAVDEGVATIKDESDKMRSEIDELEMANKTVLMRANEAQMMKNSMSFRPIQRSQLNQNSNLGYSGFNVSSIQRSPRRQSAILSEAQEKLELIKKKREEAMKILSDQF